LCLRDIPAGFGTLAAGISTALHGVAADPLTTDGAAVAHFCAHLADVLDVLGSASQEIGTGLGDLDGIQHQLDMLLFNVRPACFQAVVYKGVLANVPALPAGGQRCVLGRGIVCGVCHGHGLLLCGV
jgi:hypothetical protein